MKNCEARQYSDQMQCARCGLAWDVNDHEPPACLPRRDVTVTARADVLGRETARRTLRHLKKELQK